MLTLASLSPQQPEWHEYVALSCAYVLKYWPDASGELSPQEFQEKYEQHLLQRVAEGGRGLFLLQHNGSTVGLSNAYIHAHTLYIAEFYVTEECRLKGYGQQMFQLLMDWGQQQHATHVYIAVDKHLEAANHFWSSMHNLALNNSGDRNVYQGTIPRSGDNEL